MLKIEKNLLSETICFLRLRVYESSHTVSFYIYILCVDPVVQSIVILTSSLRGQLVKCFTTLYPKTLDFFVEKMREAFALQKLLTFFQQKYWHI